MGSNLVYGNSINAILFHLKSSADFRRLQDLPGVECDEQTLIQIAQAAASVAEGILSPFNRQVEAQAPKLMDGKVHLAQIHHDAWRAFVEGGWTTLEAPREFGGAGLPQVVHAACEELFNRASPAFGMLPTPMRCAVRVLDQYGSGAIKAKWLPPLIDGSCGATICISEAEAGSDVSRLRTRAVQESDGSWKLTGEKMWISFGSHDLTGQIAHIVLARIPGAPAGSQGLSLFLVPGTIQGSANAIVVRRIEEKLGLHGSPTCQLGFEGARGWLIGEEGRGLSQLFAMITGMRLSVGSQGAGIAGAAADLAWRYAEERRQGGQAGAPPVPINHHGDVQRMLLTSAARAEMARGLVLAASLAADLQERETDALAREEAAALLAWLLPITKNFCAEAAFTCANEAIQVLGGAGYTREWPAEQYLRDARVLSIYEGTSGMQALDLTLRRTLGGEGRSINAFLRKAAAELASSTDDASRQQFASLLDMLETGAGLLDRGNAASISYPFLQLASLATTGWIALRLTTAADGPGGERLKALGRHWLRMAAPLAQAELSQIAMGNDLIKEFAQIREAEPA